MIYIITPNLLDFKRVCQLRGIEIKFNFNGFPINKDVRWIRNWKTLQETTHMPTEVIYGFEFYKFQDKEQEQIKNEITMRQKS